MLLLSTSKAKSLKVNFQVSHDFHKFVIAGHKVIKPSSMKNMSEVVEKNKRCTRKHQVVWIEIKQELHKEMKCMILVVLFLLIIPG